MLLVAVCCSASFAVGTLGAVGPDLLVSDLSYTDFQLFVELQNQGPGSYQGPVEVEIVLSEGRTVRAKLRTRVAGPWPAFAVRRSSAVDISKLLNFDSPESYTNFSASVTVDPAGAVPDTRRQNNSYYRFFSMAGEDADPNRQPRGDYKTSTTLPDLVVEDIVFDPPYVKARFSNRGGEASGADFRFRWYANGQERGSTRVERYKVPPSGQSQVTGGMSMNRLNLVSGNVSEIRVVIDDEDRVRESREDNNTVTKRLQLGPQTTDKDPLPRKEPQGTVTIGTQGVMPVVCSYLVRKPDGGQTLYLLPFVPDQRDIADMKLGQIGQIGIRRHKAGLTDTANPTYLSLSVNARDLTSTNAQIHPRTVKASVHGPERVHAVNMKVDGKLSLGPWPIRGGEVPWSIHGSWMAGKDNVTFDASGSAVLYNR